METANFKLTRYGLEISGSEEFVTSQINDFKANIDALFEAIKDGATNDPNQSYQDPNASRKELINMQPKALSGGSIIEADYVEVKKNDSIDFSSVIVIQGSEIQIIADIPGNTTSKKMLVVILLYMWAKLRLGVETCSFGELRDVCAFYGVLDAANFARHMDSHKKFFMVSGDNKSKTARLIRPGILEAEKLIKQLSENKN